MKSILSAATVVAAALLTGACERQPYSETRVFTHHGEHGAAHAGDGAKEGHAAPTTPAPAEGETKH